MTDDRLFARVGILPEETKPAARGRRRDLPLASLILLGLIALGCALAPVISAKDPTYMDLARYSTAPCAEFPFGTDPMGRDIFAGIWYGGRVSLLIGFLATAISTGIAVVFGSVSGIASKWIDTIMMRLTEILLSIPGLLLIIFMQAILGSATVLSMSIVIGITGWYSVAKVIRTEVRKIRMSEYVIAARCMGGGFFHILWQHLLPNFVSSIMFMVVMHVRTAIVAESTLSFMGMGLPPDTVSWGGMLSLSERALMTGQWWVILIPGAFLVIMLVCLTNVGNWLRRSANRRESNL